MEYMINKSLGEFYEDGYERYPIGFDEAYELSRLNICERNYDVAVSEINNMCQEGADITDYFWTLFLLNPVVALGLKADINYCESFQLAIKSEKVYCSMKDFCLLSLEAMLTDDVYSKDMMLPIGMCLEKMYYHSSTKNPVSRLITKKGFDWFTKSGIDYLIDAVPPRYIIVILFFLMGKYRGYIKEKGASPTSRSGKLYYYALSEIHNKYDSLDEYVAWDSDVLIGVYGQFVKMTSAFDELKQDMGFVLSEEIIRNLMRK